MKTLLCAVCVCLLALNGIASAQPQNAQSNISPLHRGGNNPTRQFLAECLPTWHECRGTGGYSDMSLCCTLHQVCMHVDKPIQVKGSPYCQ
ncbi:MAG: hypothetical protein J0I19_16535 [Alphaproteobacteria bacterium]|nr:hypothetical protein [Alphaproteobacteria bacterium]